LFRAATKVGVFFIAAKRIVLAGVRKVGKFESPKEKIGRIRRLFHLNNQTHYPIFALSDFRTSGLFRLK
jgi:hypothetical protein